MRHRTLFTSLVIAMAVMFGLAELANAGDLNPPPGPIGPTMKTLVEVEPRTPVATLPGSGSALHVISQPGSYYLTGNITGFSEKNGIVIAAGGVTLDLGGFAVIGVAGSLKGISVLGRHVNVSIRNGSVRGWGEDGIDAFGADNSTLEAIHASNNGIYGLRVRSGSTIANCTSRSNGGNGINIGEGSIVSQSTSSLNGGSGFELGMFSSAIGCVAKSNGQAGRATGISAVEGCTIKDSSVSLNIGDGIFAGGRGSTIKGCSAWGNTGTGIAVGDSNVVVDSTSIGNTGAGITAGDGSNISQCTARDNGTQGILVGGGVAVRRCVVRNNGLDGIRISARCYVYRNLADSNGLLGEGAGIHQSEGEASRIEGNNVTSNDRGIDVDSAGNLIIQNSARNNGNNYDIVPGNTFGQILSGTGQISVADPWANFSF